MVTYHWMNRADAALSIFTMKRMFAHKEKFGYDSILLTSKGSNSDNWIKAAHIVDPSKKIKFMIAVRPYQQTAQIVNQMAAAFAEIAPHRLMLNVVSGEMGGNEIGLIPEGSYEVNTDITTPLGRLEFIPEWMERLSKTYVMGRKPIILLGTRNKDVILKAAKYADIGLVMLDDFLADPDLFLSNYKRVMVSAQIVIRNTYEEAHYELENSFSTHIRIKRWAIYGSREDIKKKLLELEAMGVTDILLSNGTDVVSQSDGPVDELVWEIIQERKNKVVD
jgi:alkanesulfonate monooxygenase SsuD/methylene tetrahydromethanopterin reductase-like flavin-dependent oxidoreductase (luciferase family)